MPRVVIDTMVWSAFLRKETPDPETVANVSVLARSRQALLIGSVRQELLSGIRNVQKYEEVKEKARALIDHPLVMNHFETAAYFANTCLRKGVHASTVDFQLCAVSYLDGAEIYTFDKDFAHIAKVIPIRLFAKSRL